MKKETRRKIFENKRVVLLSAFLLAVLSWVIVAGFIDPGDTRTITGVNIDYTHKDSDYKNKSLQIVSDQKNASYADVMVSGDGSVTTTLKNTDITVYPDYSTVNGPGEYVLPLKAEKIKSGNYAIVDVSLANSQHSLKSNPTNTITVVFEEITSKTFPVVVKADGITAAEGYFRDTATAIPAEVTLTGPKSELGHIAQVVALVDDEEVRSESLILNGVPLLLYDANGMPIESDQITISPSNAVEVRVPILEVKTIDLSVNVSGVPQGFDIEWLQTRLHLSTEQLQVVGTSAALANLSNPFPVYTIDISELTLGWTSEPFDIELPEGVHNLDQLRQVAVSFDSEGLVQKDFDVSNINIVNAPRNTTITPVSDTVANVTLIGPPEQIDALLPENITVEIDAFDITSPKTGQQTIPARVLVPSASQVFASGSYPVVCNLEVETNAASS